MDCRTMITLLLPTFFAVCLTIIIALATRTVIYPIKNEYGVLGITAESLLQIIAGVNKFLDVVAIGSLGALANAINQIRLAHPEFNGIKLQDLDIKDALCDPLRAAMDVISEFWLHRTLKIAPMAISRATLTLATAACVWLLPLASNTLLIPKPIYHPLLGADGWPKPAPTYLCSPRVLIDDLSWPDTSSDGRLASMIYSAFFELNEDYRQGWNDALHLPNQHMTAYMQIDPYRMWGATVRAADIKQVFASTLKYGPSYAKRNVGFWADINVTTVSVDVRCDNAFLELGGTPGINISGFTTNSTSSPIFTVQLSSMEQLNFSAITCNISLHQALFPIGSWTLPDTDPSGPGVTIHIDPGPGDYLTLTPHTTDPLLSRRLDLTLQQTLPELESIAAIPYPPSNESTSSYLHFLITRARKLRARQQDLQQDLQQASTLDPYSTDIPYITRLLTLWAQHTLTLATWSLSTHPKVKTYSRCVHYMVYASGPRLRWQSAILIVPCWLLFVMLAGIAFCLYYGFDKSCKGRVKIWSPAHMLVAANQGPRIAGLRDTEDAATGIGGRQRSIKGMRKRRIYLRRGWSGQLVLTDNEHLAWDEGSGGEEESGDASHNEDQGAVDVQEGSDEVREVRRYRRRSYPL